MMIVLKYLNINVYYCILCNFKGVFIYFVYCVNGDFWRYIIKCSVCMCEYVCIYIYIYSYSYVCI